MTTHECNDCHHTWVDDDAPAWEGDWEPINLADMAAKIRNATSTSSPSPHPSHQGTPR